MSVKGRLDVTRIEANLYSVIGTTMEQGHHLGYVSKRGKAWEANDATYPTIDHAVLALARGQNRRFSPRASFHRDRIVYEDSLLEVTT